VIGKILPTFSTHSDSPNSSPSSSRGSSPTKNLEDARRETALARTRPGLHSKTSSSDSETPPGTMTHRAYSFKFSLEWAQHFEKPNGQGNGSVNGNVGGGGTRGAGGVGFNMGAERRLCAPRLPISAHSWVGTKVPGSSREVHPRDPALPDEVELDNPSLRAERVARAKYSGRALAEWSMIVGECNNFVERRRAEGAPGLKWVEVPALGVEGFRKLHA
jgi:hypothetical protein